MNLRDCVSDPLWLREVSDFRTRSRPYGRIGPDMPIRNLARTVAIGSVAPPPRNTIPAIVTARPPKRLDAHRRYMKLAGRDADAD